MKDDLVSFACPGCGDLGIFCFNGVEGRKEGRKEGRIYFCHLGRL